MGFALVILGGFAVLMPGYLDPYAPVNGLTLLGFGLIATGVWLSVNRG